MTTLTLPLDRTYDRTVDAAYDTPRSRAEVAFDLTVVTIESMVARDISAFTERNRRAAVRTPERTSRERAPR